MQTPKSTISRGHLVRTFTLIIIILLATPACSLIEGSQDVLWSSASKEEAQPKAENSTNTSSGQKAPKVSIEGLDPKKTSNLSDIEIMWQIPEKEVDGFVLKYGTSRDDLDKEKRVSSQQLEKFEDPKYGFVYRYVLDGVPLNQNIFVSISALNQGRISRPSPVIEVPADSAVKK